MQIIYPYNEILPTNRAHDIYIMHTCQAFAEQGCTVTLICGKSSQDLAGYYFGKNPLFTIQMLPLIRKNNFLKLSWNRPFFLLCQNVIKKNKPAFVFLSTLKQSAFHTERRIPGIRYVYEVHQLHQTTQEKEMLKRCDLITTTTHALKEKLLRSPYEIQVPIEVIPLAVNKVALKPQTFSSPFKLFYVGQLYTEQGIAFLLNVMHMLEGVHLSIIGGTEEDVKKLSKYTHHLGISSQVTFYGWQAPCKVAALACEAHAFIAPFLNQNRMPYVAHTKLYEYAEWGRPIIAPDLPAVTEHFLPNQGLSLFRPEDASSLVQTIKRLQEKATWEKAMQDVRTLSGQFTWKLRTDRYLSILEAY